MTHRRWIGILGRSFIFALLALGGRSPESGSELPLSAEFLPITGVGVKEGWLNEGRPDASSGAPDLILWVLGRSSVALSSDRSVLVLSAELPGGFGGRDLHVSFLEADGTWTHPRNLGPSVNTGAEEENPEVWGKSDLLFYSCGGRLCWLDLKTVGQLRSHFVL
jgi:hypothetical protein